MLKVVREHEDRVFGRYGKQTMTSLAPFYAFWSQEEGGGLFFVIDRLVPDWKAQYFGSELPSPFKTLRIAVGQSVPNNHQDK